MSIGSKMESQNTPDHLHEDIKKLVGLLEHQSAMASNRLSEGVSTPSSISKSEVDTILGRRRKYLFKQKPAAVTTGR